MQNIEYEVVALLREKKMTIATAESCTGGLVAAALINVAGASDVIKESYITYADETKQKILGVLPETLQQYTAVSQQTAEEMVRGVTRIANTKVGISVTGIAGPDGGTKDFPVGLVYVGYQIGEKVAVSKYIFAGDRMQVRLSAVDTALHTILSLLKEEDFK